MRYFTKLQSDGSAYSLYRFEVQEKKILEECWTLKGWQHDQDARIVGYLSIAEPDLDEISEAHAQSLFPQVFGLPVAPKVDSIEGVAAGKKKYFKMMYNEHYIKKMKHRSAASALPIVLAKMRLNRPVAAQQVPKQSREG